MSHADRHPVCECDSESPAMMGEGTPAQFVMCADCSGLIQCTFCDQTAYSWTPGDDYVCRSCGEEILSNVP